MKINYKQIFINVIEHFADMKIQYLFITIIIALLWVFMASVSLNKDLINKEALDLNNIHSSMNILSQGIWLFFILAIFGCICSLWIIIQDVHIKQSIKKYNLGIIK